MDKKSYYAYIIILAILVTAYILGPLVAGNHENIRLIDWDLLLLWLLGFFALFFQKQAGFPQLMDQATAPLNRFGIPLIIGMCFGIADILVFEIILKHPPYKVLPPFLQPFPYSILLYTSGAVYVEILHRLLPLTIVMLLSKWLLPAKYQHWIFWIFAIFTSLWEPLEQMPSGSWGLIVYSLVSGFAFNFLQAVYFKKAGWLAALIIRLGHYLLWHILLGVYVEYFVL
ncbi:MAG: hypothetical protein JW830_04470 [Bacteroidales bacterium]|nr:hypothetical protein [Bacteroidales bacterium]